MRYRGIGVFVASWLLASAAVADIVQLKADHPDSYVVKKGDTLWDISGHFLSKPWLWPKLWHINPQIRDPHWIYPGDVLKLVWVNGEPRLVREGGTDRGKPLIKLSPKSRVVTEAEAVPTLKYSSIAPFLRSDHIFPANENLNKLPYLLGNNMNYVSLTEKQRVFVKGSLKEGQQYGIYHPGAVYKDPKSGAPIGQEAILTGIAIGGQPKEKGMTEAWLIKSLRESSQGDLLLPLPDQEKLQAYFSLQPGHLKEPAQLLDSESKSGVVGKFEVVVLSKGAQDGVQSGDVFSIIRPGTHITGQRADDLDYNIVSTVGKKAFSGDIQQLPSEEIGQLMAFKVYERTSLALILKASDTVHLGYLADNPQ